MRDALQVAQKLADAEGVLAAENFESASDKERKILVYTRALAHARDEVNHLRSEIERLRRSEALEKARLRCLRSWWPTSQKKPA